MILISLATFALAAVLWVRRGSQHTTAASTLVLALAFNGLWTSGLAADFAGRDTSPHLIQWWQHLAAYVLPLAAGAILFSTLAFIRHQRPRYRRWLHVLLAGLSLIVILDPAILPLGLPDLHVAYRVISHQGVWQIAWTLLWAVPSVGVLVIIVRNYPRRAGPLFRNRVRYWTFAVAMNLIGDLLAISREPLPMQVAALIKLLAAVIATVSVLAEQLPDMRVGLHSAIRVLALGLLTFGAFMLAIIGGQWIYRDLSEPQVYVVMSSLALLLVLVYFPLRYLLNRAIDGLTWRDAIEPKLVLREYVERISQIFDLDDLVSAIFETVDRAVGVDYGTLLLCEQGQEGSVSLHPVPREGLALPPAINIDPDSPLAAVLDAAQPVSRYDLDTLPTYSGLSDTERDVLAQWGDEVYVPIRGRDQPIGILALGSKRSGLPLHNAEVQLLHEMAVKSGVALDNARLLVDLKTLNAKITELNRNLEWANRELLELDKLKSSFIGIITHELRSPFVPIELALQLVRRHGLENMLPEQREQIEEMGTHLAELRHSIDHLIAYASLVSKQRALEIEQVSLTDLVGDAVTTLNMMATARRVIIEPVMVEGLPLIYADRERMSDAIYHLIHNGIKFNRSGGVVNVRCSHRDGLVSIAVSDTGRGIPAEKLETLGDPFSQLADPMRRGIEGIGLGLALVKYIVQAHAGELRMESELGVGSTFTMILPIEGPAGHSASR
jgi:signal transduction histidine kinase